MQNEIEDSSRDPKDFWIIGWTLTTGNLEPDFYMIFSPGEQDKPLMKEGKIVLFNKQGLKKFLDEQAIKYETVENLIDLVCNIGSAFQKIAKRKIDTEASILNVLNFLLDAANVLPVRIPRRSKRIIYKLADYLTFSTDLETFFKKNHSRSDVLESVYALLGLVIANSWVLHET